MKGIAKVTKKLFLLVAITVLTVFVPSIMRCDGLIIINEIPGKFVEPARLNVKYHHVMVEINHQVAITKVDQVFENPYDFAIEGTYLFPVPEKASIHNFAIQVDGKPLKTKILAKDVARAEYESLVKMHKDPALLEYVDRGMIQAHISTVKAHEKIKVTLEYTELLTANNGTVKYHYTLGTEKFSQQPLESVLVQVNISSPQAISNIYSPTHKIETRKSDSGQAHAVVTYKEKNTRPDRDFILYYTVPHDEVGFNVLTYKEGQEDGFFLAMMSPNTEKTALKQPVVAKNIVFVIDTSGSMSGEKIEQAKQALTFCLHRLNPGDNFNVISFNSHITKSQEELIVAKPDAIKHALTYVGDLQADGGTDIDKALKEAMRQLPLGDAPNMIIFLTDGQPTVGECDIHRIINNTKSKNATNVRLFSFGVGYDVNTTLLDKISLDNKGTSDYIEPQENIEAKVSQFYLKVANPVLTDLVLDFSGTHVKEIYPMILPDLFQGSQLLVLGRYTNGGNVTLGLSGKQNSIEKHFLFSSNFASHNTENDFLPRIWASRKIAHLIDQIVLEGKNQSLIDEIVVLSRRYGIITEYTSFLVDSNAQEFSKAFITDNMFDLASSSLSFASQDQSSFSSVVRAKGQKCLRDSDVERDYGTSGMTNVQEKMRNICSRTFYLKDSVWIDALHTDASPIIKIKLFGKAYFDLMKKIPDLCASLSLGNKVIVKSGSCSICICEDGPDTLLPADQDRLITVS